MHGKLGDSAEKVKRSIFAKMLSDRLRINDGRRGKERGFLFETNGREGSEVMEENEDERRCVALRSMKWREKSSDRSGQIE